MVDQEVLASKLGKLQYYLNELKKADDITWGEYRNNIRSRAFVERFLHLCIEEVLDICNHLISAYSWREPQNFRDLFNVLTENGVIPEENLTKFQQMAAFRNLLVHRYEKIEDEIVFAVFSKRLNDFEQFISCITSWAKDKPA